MTTTWFLSLDRHNPEKVGVSPIAHATLLRLRAGKVNGLRMVSDAQKGIGFKSIFDRYAAFWRRPNKFNGGMEDGRTARIVHAMVEHQKKGEDEKHPPLEILASLAQNWKFNWAAKGPALLDSIGPGKKGVTPLQPLSPGGQIEAIEYDENLVLISFVNKGVLELPATTRLYPWAVEGAELEEGVPLGDYVSREEYSMEKFKTLPEYTRGVIIEEFIGSGAVSFEQTMVIPIAMVAQSDRASILNGGKVKSLFVRSGPRKVYASQSDVIETCFGPATI